MKTGKEQDGSSNDHTAAAAADAPARDPFIGRLVTVLAFTVLTAMLVTIGVLGIGILLSAFAGVLLAILLAGFATAVAQHTPLSYPWALTLVVLLILAALTGTAWLLAPQVAEQADEFGRMLPQLTADAQSWLQQYAWGQWILEQAGSNGQNSGGEGGQSGGGSDAAIAAGRGLLSWLSDLSTYLLVTVFVGLFAAANPALYTDGIVSLTPLRYRDGVRELLGELGHTLRWWLIGQGAAMVLIGVSTTIVLFAFGVPLALMVGLLVGLLGFIPYIGPIVGVLPVALVAAPEGGTTVLYVLLAYTGVQLLEGYVATPLIHERTVYLPPVFTIITQVLLGTVLGIKGFVMATPLAAVILVISRFYRRDFLGDPAAEVRESD